MDGDCVELIPDMPEPAVEPTPTPDELTPPDPMAAGEDPPANLGGCACSTRGSSQGGAGLAILGLGLVLALGRRRL